MATENVKKEGVTLHTLSNYENVLERALDTKDITNK